MSERSIEKALLYLTGLSLLLHVTVFAILYFLPEDKKTIPAEPYMIDLQDLPELRQPPPKTEPAKRQAERRQRVEREMAPRGEQAIERPVPPPQIAAPAPPSPGRATPEPEAAPRADLPREVRRGEGIFKPQKQETPQLAQLFPDAQKLAKMEENYRKKYRPEVAEGETTFLNTDDILFGSFLRRFETAVYGVWRYPGEAARLGIEGVTPVKITFSRKGEIIKVDILESSGSRILDDEVLRALNSIGPVGGFPRNYTKETFNLIAFFQYGIIRGASRSLH